jgi:2-C-methyl-D-erythritol 4-phosphate cytidylyltransferase
VQAAGEGQRLGLGPKAFVELGGRTLLERAVATMLLSSAHVIAAVPAADVDRARHLVGSDRVMVIAGGATRHDTLRLLVLASSASWILLHDAVRPFVTAEMSGRVLAAARRHGAAAAVLANDDFLYRPDGTPAAQPNEMVAVQKPIAFSRRAILQGLEAVPGGVASRDPSVLEVLARGGHPVAFVPGDAANVKISTPADYALAQRLATLSRA